MSKYKIIIQKINPIKKDEDFSGVGFPRFDKEETVFDAFVGEEEVIELMRVGYFLKEKIERSATKEHKLNV